MALRHGEYRESVDIDFLVSSREGYRTIRQRLTGPMGIAAIARPGAPLEAAREVRADQYGVRTLLRTGGIDIKFEIVSEGRIVAPARIARRGVDDAGGHGPCDRRRTGPGPNRNSFPCIRSTSHPP